MQHQLAPVPKWCIVTLLILFPPVGYYLMVEYHGEYAKKHWWLTVVAWLYFVVILVGVVLSGLGS